MPVKYYLHKNALSTNPESHKAVIVPHKVNTLADIIAEMVQRGTTLSEADILASLHLFFEVVGQQVQQGNHVNVPIVNIKPGISGEFSTSTATFDPSHHKLKATASVGPAIKKVMQNTATEKITQPLTVPVLNAFKDILSQNFNTTLSPGGIGQITGSHLKYNPENPNEGIFFVSAARQEYKVINVAIRTLGRLVFSIPEAMPPGNYTLEVKRAFGKSDASIRKGILASLLIIE
ncbi:DNA-binding domain-containing protein [Flavobacterium sp.]|uniref:DNA-binding domain-containing protein n=1 Tax=Flavobacterium sp. TaxID=239 RepID=UPI0025E36BBB|nr:DNA-binding domain-containing protein [Flavobacterium sp.]